jgi:hypothetical protein
LTISELIKKLQELNPNAPVLIDNHTEYSEMDTVMQIENMSRVYQGSRSWIDGEHGDGGITCYVLR